MSRMMNYSEHPQIKLTDAKCYMWNGQATKSTALLEEKYMR